MRAFCILTLVALSAHAAKPTEAEKARKAAEKKLDAFEKSYDPSKDLSHKNPEKLEKDIADLDEVFAALKAVDAAAAAELEPRRAALVEKTREGVGAAAAGKAGDAFDKHFAKLEQQFDPAKKRLENTEPSALKRARDELDRDLAKLDAAQRKPYEDRRDAFFTKLDADIAAAKVAKSRSEVSTQIPQLAAVAGAETAAPMAPTWCEGVEAALAKTYANYHVGGLLGTQDASAQTLVFAATFSCFDPGFDVRQRWVAWFRQNLINKYGLTAAATERLLKLAARIAIAGDLAAQQKATCTQHALIRTGPDEVRYSRTLERTGLGCFTPVNEDDRLPVHSVDVPHGVGSQLAGAMLAQRLITQGFHTNDGKLTGFAVANAVVPLDAAQFEKELEGWKLNDAGVVTAVLSFYGTKQAMKALEAEARARSAAVLIDAPKKGFADFEASLANRGSAINIALALEDQKRKGTLKGCAEKLYPDVAAAVKGQKASLTELRLDGLLAYKLTLCGRGDPDAPVMERVFGYYAERSVPVRGPFTAAYLALLEAHNGSGAGKAAAFDPSARRGAAPTDHGPFAPDSNPIEPPELEHNNTITPERLPAGIVKAVEKKGELTTITFRTEHFMVPVLECHETNKIDRVLPDGTILYRSNCKQVGEREETSTNQPITVPTYAANGVAAGSFLLYEGATVNDDVAGQPHRGWVVEAYESKARKTRTSLFGIAP